LRIVYSFDLSPRIIKGNQCIGALAEKKFQDLCLKGNPGRSGSGSDAIE
jgi:hypothetical protein